MTVVSYRGRRESIPGDSACVDALLVGELHKQTSSQVAGTQSSHALVRVLWTTQYPMDNTESCGQHARRNACTFIIVVIIIMLVITGCAVAPAPVLTATGFVNGRGQFSTPHRIHTP